MSGAIAEIVMLLRRFLHWWLGELSAFVPERIRSRLQGTGETLVFMPGESDAEVYLQSRSALTALGRLDTRPEKHPKESLRTILEERGLARTAYGGRLGVCIRIPAMKAARTVADLPLAAEENLKDVVSFELNRHTPFSADQAVFWYRVIDRDTTTHRLRVELIVVPNPILDRFNKVAHALDLDPDRIDVAEPGGNLAASGNLLRDKVALGAHRADTLTYGLAALVAGLVVVALYLPIYIAQQRADLVAQRFAALKATIEERAKLQTEIAAAQRENNFLTDRKMERPSVSELLFDTTHLLPDDVWLQDWVLNGNQVLLTGYAESASALIPLLERSHIFGGTNFRSPVTQDPRSGHERFNIGADIIGEKKR